MRDMKKILFYLTDYGQLTGGARQLLTLIDILDKKKYEPVVITQAKGSFSAELKKRNISYIILPLPKYISPQKSKVLSFGILKKIFALFHLLRYNLSVLRVIKKTNPEIVWGRNIKTIMFVGIPARILSKKLIWDIGIEHNSEGTVKFLHYLGLNLVDKIVVESEYIPEHIFKKYYAEKFKSKFQVIHAGIEKDRYESINLYLQKHRKRNRIFKILNIASVVPRKNQLMLVKAFKEIISIHSNAFLSIVGPLEDQEYYKEIKDYIDLHNLKRKIEFLGWQQDIPSFLTSADVLVIVSKNEGVPIVVREAMFAKLPVVATKVGGIPSFVFHNNTGFLIKKDDVPSLVNYLDILIKDSSKRSKMGNNAKEKAEQMLSMKAWASNYDSLMSSLLKDTTA